jgi:RNA polymerase sigma-70 factor (ECF subfamily)
VPANPRAWLVSAGRFKAIDKLRRRARLAAAEDDIVMQIETAAEPPDDPATIADDQLRLIFTCCHPALAPDAQVALTLREVCGLTTEEIARAFLTATPTVAQRIVRAKAKIRDAHIPYAVPEKDALPERLETVLRVVYLVFNEGYAASGGERLIRADLAAEAIRLGRLLVELLPDAEAVGLLALMLLQDSRRDARLSADGDIMLLADQDRGLWDTAEIAEGAALAARAMRAREVGAYTVQAAIAAAHATAASATATDWSRIVALYDLLLRADPSPVVALNRAVAIAMRDGPAVGLAAIDTLMADGALADFHLAHGARADLLRREDRTTEARAAYERAAALAKQEAERRFYARRLAEIAED